MKRFIPLLFIFAGFQANAAILTYTSNPEASGLYFIAVAEVTSIGPGTRDYPGGGLVGVEFRLFDGNDVEIWSAINNGFTVFSLTNFIEFDATGAVIDWYLRAEHCGPSGRFVSSPTLDEHVPFGGCAAGEWQVHNVEIPGVWESDTVLNPNTPPEADAGGPYLVAVGEEITFDGSGSSDLDGDPLNEIWMVTDGDDVVEDTGEFTAGTVPGIYAVELVVNDGTVNSDPNATTVVVYDPSGGFVTGGGWFNSPVSACPNFCDNSIGKANFGFVSKYKKGANVPTGQTQFRFSAGDLDFHSDSYDWLVINQGGTNAQYKGVGTVNGNYAPTGIPYKFMIWAKDDNPDTFRIKIWYEGDVEDFVYDNEAHQSIGGGQIVIHKK